MLSLIAFKNTLLFVLLSFFSCASPSKAIQTNKAVVVKTSPTVQKETSIVEAAQKTQKYLPLLKGKKIGVVANQSSVIYTSKSPMKYIHLVDSLQRLGVNVQKVFAPEHGFRGDADAGEHVKDGIDAQSKLPIVSLYGDNKKPKPNQLQEIDLMVFDLQDVGARFYTYISTLHYIMEACAEQGIPLLILDRPNPNGHIIDGPMRETDYESFVAMHPIPVLHGMTIGEYAQMINGEKWLKNGVQCKLQVMTCENYTHHKPYTLLIKPSPNLPNDLSINLYASLCFFEGTNVSPGRGTENQFQVYGSPFLKNQTYNFIPKPNFGAKNPKYNGEKCFGKNLTQTKKVDRLELKWLLDAYASTIDKKVFFNSFFEKLSGTNLLRKQIEAGVSETEIRKSWESGLSQFREIRQKYILY